MFLPLHDDNPIEHIKFPYVNYALMGIMICMFGVQSLLPADQFRRVVMAFGMVPGILGGELKDPLPWFPDGMSLFSYAFLHANWMHLLGNILFLRIFGDNIEDALGHKLYLVFYLLCAGFGGIAHLLMNIGSPVPLVGASGAVAGVMGAYVLLYPHARIFLLARLVILIPVPLPAFWMLGIWAATQFFYAFAGSDAPIAWWAHIGGMIAGIAFALIFRRPGVVLFGGK